jgi:hypothetical protein
VVEAAGVVPLSPIVSREVADLFNGLERPKRPVRRVDCTIIVQKSWRRWVRARLQGRGSNFRSSIANESFNQNGGADWHRCVQEQLAEGFRIENIVAEKFIQRTDWAEDFVARLASQSLIGEGVYHSPQWTDKTQKEVTDILLVLRNRALVLSIKCQQTPGTRSQEREAAWAAKAAAAALRQINGGLRTIANDTYWCDHPRRGKVQFTPGELKPSHAIVLVETTEPAELPDQLPLTIAGTPISYFDANDFCNLVEQLRTVSEIEAYLDARRTMPAESLRVIGKERSLFSYYLLNGESFSRCISPDDAAIVAVARAAELRTAVVRKAEADRYCGLIEHVADCLAERNPEYPTGLSLEDQSRFDSPSERRNYLRMQEELCDLRLAGRSLLGRHFAGLMGKVDAVARTAMFFAAVHLDSKPEFVYVLVSARGESRVELITRARTLLLAAMAFYDKRRGLAIVDRDGINFEAAHYSVPFHSLTAFHDGERFFGNLRMDHIPASLVPER